MENDSKVKSYAELYGGGSEEEDVFTEDEKEEMIRKAEAQKESFLYTVKCRRELTKRCTSGTFR